MSIMTKRRLGAACVLAATLGGLVAGCSSRSTAGVSERQARQIRGNLTPQMDTLSQRWVDVDNSWALMVNENMRMMREDWRRTMYIDRASRLTVQPIPR